MPDYFDDEEITRLLAHPKELPHNALARLRNQKTGKGQPHARSQLFVESSEGQFRISTRLNNNDIDDFSVVLGYRRDGKDNKWFRLRRYNGKHPPLGMHKNRIEKTMVSGYHIHTATLRYQERTAKEEGFAEATNQYSDIWGALDLMIRECSFTLSRPPVPKDPTQSELFKK